MLVRLACIRHAASVYPEPGSNSPYIYEWFVSSAFLIGFCCSYSLLFSFQRPVFRSRVFFARFYILSYLFLDVNYYLPEIGEKS